MPNSWHKAVEDFSPRLAVTTKLTRCSRTSIVFHGIDRYAPALAALARKCKGCLETFCKGCHETEHALWLEWGGSAAAQSLPAAGSRFLAAHSHSIFTSPQQPGDPDILSAGGEDQRQPQRRRRLHGLRPKVGPSGSPSRCHASR